MESEEALYISAKKGLQDEQLHYLKQQKKLGAISDFEANLLK
jgi:hypothetical protein